MANIITFMRSNIEKGNKWMDVDGNLCNMEKVEKTAKKAFMDALKTDSVKGSVTLNQFTKEFQKTNYTEVECVLALIEHPKESDTDGESETAETIPNN